MSHRPFWLIPLLLAVLTRIPVAAQGQELPDVEILDLTAGQAIQGNLIIRANTAVEGFQSAELYFGYAKLPDPTWFLLTRSDEPVTEEILVEWDTTTLTDGDFILRLVVNRLDGDPIIAVVGDLRVRNYTPIETDTPAPTGTPPPVVTRTQQPTITAIPATRTPLPPNPAEVTTGGIATSLLRGGLAATGAILALGVYLAIRMVLRK